MKIELSKKKIPRGKDGDPAFPYLGPTVSIRPIGGLHNEISRPPNPPCVLDVFTAEEVVYMVNRYIYHVEAQQAAHAKRARRQREALHAVRKKVKQMYGVSWDNATREQQEAALKRQAQDDEEVGKGPQAG